MTRKIYVLAMTGFLTLGAFNLLAQDDNDYTNNRGKKKRDNNAINTKKETPVKLIEAIVGTWQIDGIYKGNKDISNTDTLGTNQTIIFDRENRYVSHSGEEKIDSGMFRLNENHSILYLESESGEKPTEWNISFHRGGMTLQPRGSHPHAGSFKYRYSKTEGN